MTKKQKKMLCRIIITAVLVLAIRLFSIGGLPGTLLYLAAYLIIGYDILRKAGKGILRGQVFDENFLMAVATVGAIGLAFYEKSGDFMEAVAVMLFYQIGELFQSYAVGKSRRNITALMDIRPDYANIEQDGQLTQVDPDDVPVGATIVVQPGEKVPLDGVVLEGTSTLNTAALTGEITDPRDLGMEALHVEMPDHFLIDDSAVLAPASPEEAAHLDVLRGPNIKEFPQGKPVGDTITAKLTLKEGDNITTDHIMPAGSKILPYRSNIPKLSEFCFGVCDKDFAKKAKEAGETILVAAATMDKAPQGSTRRWCLCT